MIKRFFLIKESIIHNAIAFLKSLSEQERKRMVVEIKEYEPNASEAIRKYYWGVVLTHIERFTGHDKEDMHEYFKYIFLHGGSTMDLTDEGFYVYLYQICAHASYNLSLYIPYPGEYLGPDIVKQLSKDSVGGYLIPSDQSDYSYLFDEEARRREEPIRSEKYLGWIRTLPCCVCSCRGVDPHHIINVKLGGIMGGKVSDLLCIPVCRNHHDSIHHDTGLFEQTIYLIRTLLRAFRDNIIVVNL